MKKYYEQFHAQIWQHAYREAPNECCGLITNGSYLPCENVSTEPDKEFKIDNKVMVKAFREGLDAVIHSHIDKPQLSYNDMEQQYEMAIPWGIAFINGKQRGGIHFWGDQIETQDFVERPFIHGLYDCYSCVRDYYRETYNIWLPHVSREKYWWDRGENLIEDNFPTDTFKKVKSKKLLKKGDALLFRIRSTKFNHVAVYLGKEKMLHHIIERFSIIESIYPWLWKADVYRYVDKLVEVKKC